jgi:hypothetical protein
MIKIVLEHKPKIEVNKNEKMSLESLSWRGSLRRYMPKALKNMRVFLETSVNASLDRHLNEMTR